MMNISPKHKVLSHYLRENPESASVIMMNSGANNLSDLFMKIPGESLLPCLNLLPQSILAESFDGVDDSAALATMNLLPANLVAGVFRQWRGSNTGGNDRVNHLLKGLDIDLAKAVGTLLNYPVGTIGSLMNPIPLSVKSHMTAKEVLALLQRQKNRYSRYIYVVDENFCLEGVLPFKEVFYSDGNSVVSQLMTSSVFAFSPDEDAKKAIVNSSWKKWDSIPVVDVKKRLIGVIRFDVIESFTLGPQVTDTKEKEIQRAGAAVGEIFQIGINATISALGIDEREGR